ncbi:tyrosine-type recombinase/integrase [Burkholderia cenocepacia]|uniref:tyrosine-type recombinase/integrase n=1 Tax=Burkholderia cenocepacia TaxID=95486 RepID=UPI001B8E0719|nr:tyrosine-type recombinase/integrase [Burkholderia cenocepacia]MBR8043157.1 tyrosine-type recombinase/integrase [Burkholderia cenocepacia]MBR8324473.1 tyrosine-type recombinase/integrase [Burkholderia cenocepacia]
MREIAHKNKGQITGTPERPLTNRRESPILPTGMSDEDMVRLWLETKSTGRGRLSPTTLAQYRTEAERLFWYARKIDLPLSAWTVPDFNGYISFLSAPEPWAIRARGVRRGTPEWRPFLGPLADSSAGQSQKIVTSLFAYMHRKGYLAADPASDLPTVGRAPEDTPPRFLSPASTALIRKVVAAREIHTREDKLLQARDSFLVDLFERTGLRTTEAMRANMRDIKIESVPAELLREYPDAPPLQWLLRVIRGKGGKSRWVPFNEMAVSLQQYRMAFGLPPLPAPDETLPLVMTVRKVRRENHVSRMRAGFGQTKGDRTGIYKVIKGLCGEAIEWAMSNGHTFDAEQLQNASTHWLRHSYAKTLAKAVANGLEPRAALDNMGHSDWRTFQKYNDDEPLKRALATARALRDAT